MLWRIFTMAAVYAITLSFAVALSAQQLQIIGQDPVQGPICLGPLGPGPCAQVQEYVRRQQGIPPLQQIGLDPRFGPICAGPLGPGPCEAVARYLQQQFGQRPQIRQVASPDPGVIGRDPVAGPICAGPLGPGPCNAVRSYLARLTGNFQPVLPDLRSIEVNSSDIQGVEAMCSGPAGEQPCSVLQQEIIDSGRGATMPLLEELRNGESLSAEEIATACAEKAGLDVVNFSSCTGGRVILSPRQQEMLDCATSSEDTAKFATCAAPLMGVKVSKRQEKLAACAIESQGESDEFINCAGGALLSRQASTSLKCYRDSEGNTRTFAECAALSIVGDSITEQQKRAIACLAQNEGDVVGCAAEEAGLSEEQKAMVDCAVRSNGTTSGFIDCAGGAVVDRYLGRDAQTALRCAADSDRPEDFAVCAATGILGQNASKEQRIALTCAADSGGDLEQMAVCAGANMLNIEMGLNAEQQIAVQCLVSTGGQPYAAAGCMASRLTARELTKCFTDGVGRDGCFGDNNDLVGRNGWTARTLRQIGGGPNSVINRPDQIWGGSNSFVRNPSQIWGGNNSFVRNPSQMWGGSNSVFNNPGQLAPEPVQLGKIGNTRICLPWC